jgi:predicted DNA-binding ribbon-helix-helix protein
MKRTTIMLPPDLMKQLRRIAAEREMSVAALVREVLEEKASEHRSRSLGIGSSGFSDTTRRAVEERSVPGAGH